MKLEMNMTLNWDNVRYWIKGAILGSIVIFILFYFVALSSEPYKAAHKFLSTDDAISTKYGQPLKIVLIPYGYSYSTETMKDINGKLLSENGDAKFIFWVSGSNGHGSVSIELKDREKTWEKIKIN